MRSDSKDNVVGRSHYDVGCGVVERRTEYVFRSLPGAARGDVFDACVDVHVDILTLSCESSS